MSSTFLQGAPGGFMQGLNFGQQFDYNRQMHPLQIQQQKMQNDQMRQMNPLLLIAQQMRNKQYQQQQDTYANYIRMMDAITRSGMGSSGVPGADQYGVIPQGLPPTAQPQNYGGPSMGGNRGGATDPLGSVIDSSGGAGMSMYPEVNSMLGTGMGMYDTPLAANQFSPMINADQTYLNEPAVTDYQSQVVPLSPVTDYGGYGGMWGPVDSQGLLSQFFGLFG